MTTLEGQTILIVGGSSGIGYGVAKLSLLSQASLVIIASSNKSKVDTALSRLVSDVDVAKLVKDAQARVKGDVVDAKELKEVTSLMERVGEVDHVVWTSGDAFGKATYPPRVDLNELKGASSLHFLLYKIRDIFSMPGLYDVRFWGAIEAARSAKFKAGGSFIITCGTSLMTLVRVAAYYYPRASCKEAPNGPGDCCGYGRRC